jgi:nitroimidazol reductase NimA-like FMN-containing flavoprotein (pyridoxamine 5'-phosphate oxidase superfamily)
MLSYTSTGKQIRELAGFECLALVASVTTGRIAYDDADGPIVLAVNHVVDNGTIVLRTTAAGQLAALTHRDRVAYEVVDQADRTRPSWSVLVRGWVRPLDDEEVRALPPMPVLQVEDGRPLHLRLTPRTVIGRRRVDPD